MALRANPTRNNLNNESTINEIIELSCAFPNPGEKPGIRVMIILVTYLDDTWFEFFTKLTNL
jgi:hypothetical protein